MFLGAPFSMSMDVSRAFHEDLRGGVHFEPLTPLTFTSMPIEDLSQAERIETLPNIDGDAPPFVVNILGTNAASSFSSQYV